MAQREKRLTGRNPLSYLGTNPYAPANVTANTRAPLASDIRNVLIGDIWIDTSSTPKDVYMLVSLSAGVATWILLTASFDGTLTDHGVVVADGANSIKTIPVGNTGELLTGVTGSDPVFDSSSDGDFSFFRNDAGSRELTIASLDNTSSSSHAALLLSTGGASGGDPEILFTPDAGSNYWSLGVDNDDSDKFKISKSIGLGLSNAVSIDSSRNVELPVSLTLSAEGAGVMQTDAGGLVSSSAGTDGQVLISDTGIPTWTSLTYETDDGTATTDEDGIVKVLGGDNVNIEADGNAITIHSNSSSYFESLSSDPSDPLDGQVWYNTTTQDFKGAKAAGADVWTSKAVFPFPDYSPQYGASGTAQESLNSGNNSGSGYWSTLYELLTDSFSLRQKRNNAFSAGTLTGDDSDEGISAGGDSGSPKALTEVYEGLFDSWTNTADLNQARYQNGASGTASDSLVFGGRISDPGSHILTTSTERYDGGLDSWTNKALLNAARRAFGGTGTAADSLCAGGVDSAGTSIIASVERYDGGLDSWTTKAAISVAADLIECTSTAADALAIGGNTALPTSTYLSTVEIYNGGLDSWSAGPPINTARRQCAGTGSASSDALICGGTSALTVAPTEKLDGSPTIVTFTVT